MAPARVVAPSAPPAAAAAPAIVSPPSTPVQAANSNGVHEASPATIKSMASVRTSYTSQSKRVVSGTMDSSSMHFIRETGQSLGKKGAAELGFGVFDSVSSTTFIALVEYIANVRLSTLPHRGSTWDTVLIRALYFAERQYSFEKIMKSFGAEDSGTANLAYGYCKLLLELGPENAEALDKAFAVLYKHALDVAALLWRTEVVTTTPLIREQLALMYGDLLTLTSVVATRYYRVVQGTASTNMTLDIYDVCHDVIQSFRDRQETVIDLIWAHQAQLEGLDLTTGLSTKSLRRWLLSMDSVQTTLTQDHTIYLVGQAESTCLWFQKPLGAFVQGNSKVMAVTGHSGSGKSVLAASTVERLQRPLGRKTFSTLYYAIPSDAHAATTPISILKSLLAQILDLRIGNMQTYHAVARAYEHCTVTGDVKVYEDHLWEALAEAFKQSLDNARDLIVVIDGLEEIHGGKTPAQAVFDRLADIVCDGKRVKLIGLATSLSMPSGIDTTHVTITREEVHEDIRAVSLRALSHSHHFHHRSSEQDQVLDRIARIAAGSFVVAILVSDILHHLKSYEEIVKTLEGFEKTKPTVQDLVHRIFARHELSSTTRTVLGWMVHAERPLTISDMERLFTHGHKPEHGTNVLHALQHIRHILAEGDYLARFKHRSIHESVSALTHSGKIVIPDEHKQGDLLIRALHYAKAVLRDDPEPELGEIGFELTDRIFREHPLLPYVIIYWTTTLKHHGEKHPKELTAALPTVTIMALIERIVWAHEVPFIEAVEMHKFAIQTRQHYLKDHERITLQSILNAALIYDDLGQVTEASRLYYQCVKISHRLQLDVLSLELGHRFLRTSETLVDTKRTEIMTYREEVYLIVITLLVKIHGSYSMEVIRMRTLLATFYEHIQEKERAAEIYELIHEATIHVHGRDSDEARGISDHLRVVLGRTKTEEKIQTLKESIFDDVQDEIDVDSLDIVTIHDRLKTAKTEREFVELWQVVSTTARSTTAIEWHQINIDVATSYSKFLISQKRTTEASAVLCSVSREYQYHHASLFESISSRLSTVATSLTELGLFTAALTLLKSTVHFHQSAHKEETVRTTEIQRQISVVESRLIETTSVDQHTDILERIFRTAISDTTKTIDIKVVTMARTLASHHVDRFEIRESIEIVKLLLTRVWSSFLTSTSRNVELTTVFQKETLDLILDFMVPGYKRLREPSNVEWALSGVFLAAITAKTVDFVLISRLQTLLLQHYDEEHQPDKAIITLQRVVAVRRAHLGTTHEDTIRILYELARRTHERARIYPGWIDFYLQIVSSLNKSNDVCHPQALEALEIVAATYWTDGRYHDAVACYRVIWNTLVKEPKQHAKFSQATFVQQLYERYYMCLERTSARYETLYQVTKQYHSTTVTIFGEQSEVTTRAMLSLARVSSTNEQHHSEARSLYERISKTSSSSFVHLAEVETALTVFFTREIIRASTSTTVSSETLESAQSRSLTEYRSSVSKFGYSSTSTLSTLHQTALLYYKQGKTDTVTKELTTATTEIITKETSSSKLIESAESIVTTFQATKTTTYLETMIAEIHRQVICKDTTHSKSWGFDLTKYGRGVLPFLAALIVKSSVDTTIAFSNVMADLLTELFYFDEYRHMVHTNASLQAILLSASALRAFLLRIHRHEAVASLDKDVAAVFIARDGSKLRLLSKESARLFMVAIMEYLGVHRRSPFVRAVVLASNGSIAKLMAAGSYAEAYDIANCAFEFALENDAYTGAKGIGHGFNLASTLAGIGYSKTPSDANLRKQMLQLSNKIARKVLDVCKHQNIKFTEINLQDLNRLVELLGVQEDYETLESLLTALWNTREAHRDWSSATMDTLGKDLIYARYLSGHPFKALRLCEDIAYNQRRTHGLSSPITRKVNILLAELYSSIGLWYLQQGNKSQTNIDLANQYFAKALAVHEETLRVAVGVERTPGEVVDDDDWDTTGDILREHGIIAGTQSTNGSSAVDTVAEKNVAKTHLRLLKLAVQRLGAWPGAHGEHEMLVHQVQNAFPETKELQTPDKWQIKGFGQGKAESNEGTFVKVGEWRLLEAV